MKYKTVGSCAKEISFEIHDGKLSQVFFKGGCPGNLRAISILLEGMDVQDVIDKFSGNLCRNGTSCTDQLAQALEEWQKSQERPRCSGFPDCRRCGDSLGKYNSFM